MEKVSQAGFRLVTLTNSSNQGVEQQMQKSGLDKYLTARLSVEEIGIYKPHSHVYRWAVGGMGQGVGDCKLVAAYGRDIAGAIWAGMRGAFIDRPGAQLYPTGPKPEISEPTFEALAQKLIAPSD